MLKSKIEAILFLTDKPIRAQAIARIVNEDVQVVRQAILDLINDYETKEGGLEIADDNGYIIQVKDAYASIIDEFVPMEMPLALLRTLSAIAIKQPVAQSEIIKIRGAGAYDHIRELMTRELVIKKEDGRSPLLLTTKKFQEYFRLSHDAKSLRTQLRKEDRIASKEGEGGAGGTESGESVATQPESMQSEQAKQLEVLFASSPDATLVFRAEEHGLGLGQGGDGLEEIVLGVEHDGPSLAGHVGDDSEDDSSISDDTTLDIEDRLESARSKSGNAESAMERIHASLETDDYDDTEPEEAGCQASDNESGGSDDGDEDSEEDSDL